MATAPASTTTQLRDLTIVFDRTVRAATPFYPQLANVVDSQGSEEKYGWLGDMPGMREWVGDRVFKELRAADYEIKNKDWESGLLIKRNDIDDARMLKYGPLMTGLANEASYHPDELMFSLLVAGESTLGFDGQNFFDTDHSWGDSGTQDNDLTYAAATGTVPTSAEFRAAYNAAYSAMLGYKNDQGKPFFRPTLNGTNFNVLVLVPPALGQAAIEGLNARNDANNNPIVVQGIPQIVQVPYLTDATKFYVINAGQALKPFVFQRRLALQREMKNMNDIEYKDVKFMTWARYNVGLGAWWNAVLTTFT